MTSEQAKWEFKNAVCFLGGLLGLLALFFVVAL